MKSRALFVGLSITLSLILSTNSVSAMSNTDNKKTEVTQEVNKKETNKEQEDSEDKKVFNEKGQTVEVDYSSYKSMNLDKLLNAVSENEYKLYNKYNKKVIKVTGLVSSVKYDKERELYRITLSTEDCTSEMICYILEECDDILGEIDTWDEVEVIGLTGVRETEDCYSKLMLKYTKIVDYTSDGEEEAVVEK